MVRTRRLVHLLTKGAISIGLMACGCTRRVQAPPLPQATDNLHSPTSANAVEDWRTRSKLPTLLALPIEPILEPDKFDRIYGYLAYRDAGNVVVGEAPFENDDAAIAAARAWLIDHFGALPSGVELNVTSVLHSSSGRASPAFEWDVGHTIAFEEAFHGVPVHAAGAVVYISGRTQFRASVTLLNFSPVAGSMTNVVNRAAAIDTVIQTMNASGTAPVNLAELQTRIDPQLHFVSLPMSGRYGQALQVLGPNWALDAEGRMLIDARTGRIWEND